MKRKMSEHDEQVAFFDHCKWKANSDPRYGLIWANCNAGKSYGARSDIISLKAYSGVPDITVAVPSKNNNKGGMFSK